MSYYLFDRIQVEIKKLLQCKLKWGKIHYTNKNLELIYLFSGKYIHCKILWFIEQSENVRYQLFRAYLCLCLTLHTDLNLWSCTDYRSIVGKYGIGFIFLFILHETWSLTINQHIQHFLVFISKLNSKLCIIEFFK